ncbi:MAG: hypothetical protein CMQ20_10685 [Gammaproteobacteria bacterium]|nr:hypothetical protein [Gammaproteobacteria bacterium]
MAVASPRTVLGNFSDIKVTFHNIESRMFERESKFFIETLGDDKKLHEFQISYTFGHFPLQQYLVETKKGHLQALNISWDARPKEAGGQRWIHLQPGENITPGSPFFWTRYLQNWNARCAECHSTNLKKNYDADEASYNTVWSEINVACEACHGPGSLHVERAESLLLHKGSGLVNTPALLPWIFKEGESIAQLSGSRSENYASRHVDMCGGCHSRRSVIGDLDVQANYHDKYQLALLEEGLYYADGQIQDEVYVLGSFLQSKMHANGVTCMNCHQPHSGKLLLGGNELCAQCHLADKYDSKSHHFHPVGSTGSKCIECHMPKTTYMLVDDRRDHRFGIPNPGLSSKLGVPNACNKCHAGTSNDWASKAITTWLNDKPTPDSDSHSQVNARARLGDPIMTRPILKLLEDESTPEILKATLLEQLAAFPSRVSTEAAAHYLTHPDPLVRVGAIRSLSTAPDQIRWQLLAPLARDPSRSARTEVAVALATMATEIPQEQMHLFETLIDEYRKSLSFSIDMPSTQTTLGSLEMDLGNELAAQEAFEKALAIEPDYVPALLNLADLYRAGNNEGKALGFLQRAVKFAPDSGAANFSYGLSLVRRKKYDDALPYLKAATEQEDSQPRYAYVYAVALDSVSQTDAALSYLEQATHDWPNQFDLLMAQVLYMEKLNETADILTPLSKLSRIAPNAPGVRSRIAQYIQH